MEWSWGRLFSSLILENLFLPELIKDQRCSCSLCLVENICSSQLEEDNQYLAGCRHNIRMWYTLLPWTTNGPQQGEKVICKIFGNIFYLKTLKKRSFWNLQRKEPGGTALQMVSKQKIMNMKRPTRGVPPCQAVQTSHVGVRLFSYTVLLDTDLMTLLSQHPFPTEITETPTNHTAHLHIASAWVAPMFAFLCKI